MRLSDFDDAVDVAFAREVDRRVARDVEDVACRDHIRAPEEHEDVAVGMRRRLVHELNAFLVEVEILFFLEERVGRPRAERRGRRGACRRAHRLEHVLVSDDERAPRAFLAELLREVSRDQLRAGLGDLQVAARVIRVGVRVDDQPNRLVAGDLPDGVEHVVGVLVALRVDDEDALGADLDQRVARRAGEQIHLTVNLEDVDRGRFSAACEQRPTDPSSSAPATPAMPTNRRRVCRRSAKSTRHCTLGEWRMRLNSGSIPSAT